MGGYFALFTRWLLLGIAAGAALYPVLTLPIRGATYAFIVTIGTLLGAYALTYRWGVERDVTRYYAGIVVAVSAVVWFVDDKTAVLPPLTTHAGGLSRFLVGVGIFTVSAYVVKRYFSSRTTDD